MRQYERSGVTIDQCGECRGIFLDRGELEKLLEAEANWNRRNAPTGAAPQAHQGPPPAGGYAPQPPQPAYGGGQYGYHGHYRHKRHKSFLNEVFD